MARYGGGVTGVGMGNCSGSPREKKETKQNRNLPVVDKGQFHLALKGPTAAQSQAIATQSVPL